LKEEQLKMLLKREHLKVWGQLKKRRERKKVKKRCGEGRDHAGLLVPVEQRVHHFRVRHLWRREI
jgi:hypothetical protein